MVSVCQWKPKTVAELHQAVVGEGVPEIDGRWQWTGTPVMPHQESGHQLCQRTIDTRVNE